MNGRTILFSGVVLCLSAARTDALPAFPGAEGFGAQTPGGRGGRIFFVTSLDDSGPQTLREALETEPAYVDEPRLILFRIGGVIEHEPYGGSLAIEHPYTTIAGQTAPGDGIVFKGGRLAVKTHDVIIRGMRFRAGDDGSPSGSNFDGPDAVAVSGSDVHHVIIDHCSASWATDENVSTWYGVSDVTFSYLISSEALHCAGIHIENGEVQCHSMGFLIGDHAQRISVHHNLLAHNNQRNAHIQGDVSIEWVNNIVYNWISQPTYFSDANSANLATLGDVIGNMWITGPGTRMCGNDSSQERRGLAMGGNLADGSSFYLLGNLGPGRPTDSGDEWAVATGVYWDCDIPVPSQYHAATSVAGSGQITTDSAKAAYDRVLAHAGAVVERDSVDTRVVDEVHNRLGPAGLQGPIDHVADVGGYPSYASGDWPADEDDDGMADAWEQGRGLNPADPDDRNQIAPSGYTWVEEYINRLLPDPRKPKCAEAQNSAGYCPNGQACVDGSCVDRAQRRCTAGGGGGSGSDLCVHGMQCTLFGVCLEIRADELCSADHAGLCPHRMACEEGVCLEIPSAVGCGSGHAAGLCPSSQACVDGQCVTIAPDDWCGTQNGEERCPHGQFCIGGQCRFACSDRHPDGYCPGGAVCSGGVCGGGDGGVGDDGAVNTDGASQDSGTAADGGGDPADGNGGKGGCGCRSSVFSSVGGVPAPLPCWVFVFLLFGFLCCGYRLWQNDR
jgi:hypothetical protein